MTNIDAVPHDPRDALGAANDAGGKTGVGPCHTGRGDHGSPPLPSAERIQELLFDAARLGRVDVIPALLSAGADIGAVNAKGFTPLILASYNGHAAATALLLSAGALVDQPDSHRGNTALAGVAFKGYVAIANILLAAGADPQQTNRAGQTALMMAALFGHGEIVERLLELGSDPAVQDAAGNSAISVARDQGNEQMVAQLSGRISKPD